jgi:hypothetical protein
MNHHGITSEGICDAVLARLKAAQPETLALV